eukprot:IDg7104t1
MNPITVGDKSLPYKSEQNPTGIEQDTSVLTENRNSKSVDDIPLTEVGKEWYERIRNMLSKHAGMWIGNLGRIKATEHRIELKEGVLPTRKNQCRAGKKEREFTRGQINKMTEAGIIEPSNSGWASLVVLAPKHMADSVFASTTEV